MDDPNFMLIGAQKSGTTWISQNIRSHPNIFIPKQKELHFFNSKQNYEKGIDWYRTQFSSHTGEKAVGECTPNYLWVREATSRVWKEITQDLPFQPLEMHSDVIDAIPKLVHKHYPGLKLIVSLRNPIDRAISSYYHQIRKRRIVPSRQITEVGHRLGILEMGFYYTNLMSWLEYYPLDQMLILIYETDISSNRKDTLHRVFKFLEVDSSFVPPNYDGRKYASPSQLYMRIHYYFPRLAKRFSSFLNRYDFPEIKVTSHEKDLLYRLYEREISELEKLLGRSLSIWKRES